MTKINKLIKDNIKNILLIYLYIQPIIDVITGISINKFNINTTISSIIRLSFLLFCIYYIFILSTNNKKENIKKIIIIITYILLFTITTLTYKGTNVIIYEIKNILNTFYLPIITITLINMFDEYHIKIDIKHIIRIYILYMLFIIIPNITNTGFNTYSHSKLGNIGWFQSANAISNILSLLFPLIIYYIIKSKNKLNIILLPIIIYIFVTIGTKVPLLSLLICISINLIYYFIKWTKEKQIKKIMISITSFIIITLTAIILLPKTTFYKNIKIHKEYLGINNYLEVFTDYKLIDHFIFSQRLTFLNNTNKNYINSSLPEKLTGIGYIENYNKDNQSDKTIEIDYFDIFYRTGIIGTIIYIYCMFNIFKESIYKIKENNLINTQYKTIILLILLLSLFSGHILITPQVCIYVALILTMIIKGGLYEKNN